MVGIDCSQVIVAVDMLDIVVAGVGVYKNVAVIFLVLGFPVLYCDLCSRNLDVVGVCLAGTHCTVVLVYALMVTLVSKVVVQDDKMLLAVDIWVTGACWYLLLALVGL